MEKQKPNNDICWIYYLLVFSEKVSKNIKPRSPAGKKIYIKKPK
jgi:hypothetical protein